MERANISYKEAKEAFRSTQWRYGGGSYLLELQIKHQDQKRPRLNQDREHKDLKMISLKILKNSSLKCTRQLHYRQLFKTHFGHPINHRRFTHLIYVAVLTLYV